MYCQAVAVTIFIRIYCVSNGILMLQKTTLVIAIMQLIMVQANNNNTLAKSAALTGSMQWLRQLSVSITCTVCCFPPLGHFVDNRKN